MANGLWICNFVFFDKDSVAGEGSRAFRAEFRFLRLI